MRALATDTRNRQGQGRKRLLGYGLGLLLVVAPLTSGASSFVALSSEPVLVGQVARVATSLSVGAGEAISAVSVDLLYPATVLDPGPGCAIDAGIGPGTVPNKDVQVSMPEPGVLRIAVIGLNVEALPSGPLFDCDFATDPTGPVGSFEIGSRVEGSTTALGSAVIIGGVTLVQISEPQAGVVVCGDVNGSGFLDTADVDLIRASLADSAASLAAPDRCSVVGGAMDCDMADVVVLRRYIESGMGPGPSQVCQAAQSQ